MNVARIRGFLLSLPKPAAIRISSDGDPEVIKPGKSYQKTAETIAALAPELIECLDSDGKILRALRTDTPEAQRSAAAALPSGLEADPQALLLTHFANLLHRAYEHSTEIAFARLVELVERMGDRSEAIEQRLERTETANRRLLQDQVDDAFERAQEVADKASAESGGDLVQQMGAAFLSGKLSQPPRPTNGNGKPTPPARGT